jgi:hypothetical protein
MATSNPRGVRNSLAMIHSISALIKGIEKELTCIGEEINHDFTLKMALETRVMGCDGERK